MICWSGGGKDHKGNCEKAILTKRYVGRKGGLAELTGKHPMLIKETGPVWYNISGLFVLILIDALKFA